MPTLLQVDSSPLLETSVSRELTRHFVNEWKTKHPSGTVVVRDLWSVEIPPVSADWVRASFTPATARTPEQRAQLELSNELISELQTADEYVFGVPMHNFSIPSTLKLWIDQISRAGVTFAYVDRKPVGLLTGKKATFLTASGGTYDEGTAMASLNFVQPYLRAVFGFVGVNKTSFVNAGNTASLMHGADRGGLLASHLAAISEQIKVGSTFSTDV
jgi:FMN-dependent NADH-azoreductase